MSNEQDNYIAFIKEDVKTFFLKSAPLILLLIILTVINNCNNKSNQKYIEKHIEQLEQSFNKELSHKQKEIEILQKQKDSLVKINSILYFNTIKKDSLNNISLYNKLNSLNKKYEKDISYISNLSVDSNLLFLSKYLSQDN